MTLVHGFSTVRKFFWESLGWLAQHEMVRCPTQASSGHRCKIKATCWCYCGRLSTGVTWAVLSLCGPCAPCLPTVSTDLLFTSRGQFMDTRDRQLWLCRSQQVFLLFGDFLFVCFGGGGFLLFSKLRLLETTTETKFSSVQFKMVSARKSPYAY